MTSEVQQLKNSMISLKIIADQMVKDANPSEKIQIISALRKSDGKWAIKVKAPENANGNFRNLEIWEKEGSKRVCYFDMVEPGDEIKVISKIDISPGIHLVARIADRDVSDLFLVKFT